ncbi:FAD-dependent monooxygenase [Streptomyces griseorubiginosus]|uniref:FAD-dependent monooxygenase n=1 Tax=Streptomyces griseorubiginosus TaxID=67304 RepID=UPI000D14E6BE|nr:FAD-dependent monooxygenase [Streptomyces griseorubiginosus]
MTSRAGRGRTRGSTSSSHPRTREKRIGGPAAAHASRARRTNSSRITSATLEIAAPDRAEDATAWSDDRIWTDLQERVVGPTATCSRKAPPPAGLSCRSRSFVPETMRYGNLVLAGHARHTARPTGAKGLNLALADVRILSMHVQSHLQHGVVARTSTSIARCGGWGKHSTSRTG